MSVQTHPKWRQWVDRHHTPLMVLGWVEAATIFACMALAVVAGLHGTLQQTTTWSHYLYLVFLLAVSWLPLFAVWILTQMYSDHLQRRMERALAELDSKGSDEPHRYHAR